MNYDTLKKVGMIHDEEINKPEVKPETKPEVKPEETNKPQENTSTELNSSSNAMKNDSVQMSQTQVPQTGATANALMYFALVVVSAGALVMTYKRTRKAMNTK